MTSSDLRHVTYQCPVKINRMGCLTARPATRPRAGRHAALPEHTTHGLCTALSDPRLLVFYNVTNKIHKRMNVAVIFTQEYFRVSYTLRNMSTLSTGSG